MTTSTWYLLASLLLASAAGQLIGGRSRSFYQNLESSSPAPRLSPSELQQAEGEELIVYLTSEQVEVLKAAGAVVQPLPELEKQFRQNDEEQTGAQLRPTSTEDSTEDKEQDDNNEALDIEQQERESEENLLEENQSAEESLENSERNNKGTSQTRQREPSKSKPLRKLNKGKPQEIGKPKSKLNRNQPRGGNKLEDKKPNTESRGLAKISEPRQPVEIENVDELRQVVEDIKSFLSNNAEEAPEQAEEPEEDVSDANDNEPETIQDTPQNPAKVWESAPLRESSKIRKNQAAEGKQKATIANPRTIQRQYSSLSTPVAQQQRKTQKIVEQTEQLVEERTTEEPATNTEEEEQTGNDADTYAAEIQNLKEIVERIELAQKKSLEAAAKKTRTQETNKTEEETQNRRPAESENQDDSKPVLVKINKPLRWRWPARSENIRPVPIPVLLNENAKVRRSAVKIQRPIARQYYVNTGRPYLQKESDYKAEIPSSLAIIQRIWDN